MLLNGVDLGSIPRGGSYGTRNIDFVIKNDSNAPALGRGAFPSEVQQLLGIDKGFIPLLPYKW